MATLGVQIEPHLCDTIPGETEHAHLLVFIRQIVRAELLNCNLQMYDTGDIEKAVTVLCNAFENILRTNTNTCQDAAILSALVRRILQDGIADSRDTSTRGYGDDRDGLFAGIMRSQVPDGLRRAGGLGDKGEDGDKDPGGGAGGSGGGGGGGGGGGDGAAEEKEV